MNFYRVLTESAARFTQKPAIVYKDKSISFEQLRQQSLSLARGLSSLSVSKGVKVAIYLPNCPEYVMSYLACFCCGATLVPLDIMLKADELIACISHAECSVVIALQKSDIDWEKIRTEAPTVKKVIILGPIQHPSFELPFEALLANPGDLVVDISPSDTALIMYTSGTTGKPKGIVLTYQHLDGSPEAMKYFVDLSDRDVKICAIPLSHIGGFIYIQNSLVFGITTILMDRFNPIEFLKLVEQFKVTCFHIVPAMYTALLTLKNLDKYDLSSLRWVVVFGAPSSPEILERFHRYCPNAKLLNGWGMTETCPPNTVTPLTSNRIESVGKPAPNCEIGIVNDDDQLLETGQIGEIVIRGWVIMQEYYKDPELTAQTKRNGWFHTGDLGRFDDEGFLYIVGRKKEMIKVAGQIVFAPEVESALYKHEGVLEAAVIGVPDNMRGEVVQAWVVLKPGIVLSSEELRFFAKEHLANFKVPQQIHVVDSLPKNRTGKIDKLALIPHCTTTHYGKRD